MSGFETGNKLRLGPDGGELTRTMITTNSLRFLDLADPNPDDICLLDIAHGLSQTCRWAGQGRWLSVAQHSVEVLRYLEESRDRDAAADLGSIDDGVLVAALLHDAHEAYVGDLTGAMKYLMADSELAGLLLDLDTAIGKALGVQMPTGFTQVEKAIRWAEDQLVLPEYNMLFKGVEPSKVGLFSPLCVVAAKDLFLGEAARFGLTEAVGGS